MASTRYARVLLKVSGEGLCAPGKTGIDGKELRKLANEIKLVVDLGVQVCVVVGGGNLVRGAVIAKDTAIEETTGHYMGMLATVINALAVQDTLESLGVPTRVQLIVTTQSPWVVEGRPHDEIVVLSRDFDTGRVEVSSGPRAVLH